MQSMYTSSWSQASAGEPPSLPSSYLAIYTRPRWVRHLCRVGEYPCGGYGQVGAGQASWYDRARRRVEKQRHMPMALVQHGSQGQNHRGGYSIFHPPSPAVRAATPFRPPSRPAPSAPCAVRALGRVRARAPPLPPCLRGKTGAGGS